MKILLVDDHALFRAGLRLLLSTIDRDAFLLEAGTLAEALAIAAANPDLQLCLLDLTLREDYGLRAVAQLRAAAPAVAIVVVSGSEEPSVVRSCIDNGAMSFIPKSAEPEELASALRRVLQGQVVLPCGIHIDDVEPQSARPVLTPRQRDVLRCLQRGLPTKLIARELAISEYTAKEYIARIFEILGVRNRTEAVIRSSRSSLRPHAND
ncbi:response regulator [Burkholderiales bacterium GJ-E10]|nr:response regulator [Burkholderiales bacterium GJ-E10]